MDDLDKLEELNKIAASYMAGQTFSLGDLVTWKPGLRNRKMPDYGEPMVVVEVLEASVHDETADSGSPYFREPLNVRCLLIDDDGDALIFHYDSRRLMPYQSYRLTVSN